MLDYYVSVRFDRLLDFDLLCLPHRAVQHTLLDLVQRKADAQVVLAAVFE